jgi:hypothetical protein
VPGFGVLSSVRSVDASMLASASAPAVMTTAAPDVIFTFFSMSTLACAFACA